MFIVRYNKWEQNLLCNVTLQQYFVSNNLFTALIFAFCRSQWPCGLRRRSAAACLLRSWVRIPPGAWIFVCCECRVLSGRGLCYELITRPEESYRLCCVVVCDLETSRIGAPYIYDISHLRVKVNQSQNHEEKWWSAEWVLHILTLNTRQR